ncbi:Pentatricopeptide repeat [Parasponia andersonii]|uniref:Pentatricopeptide repeat n=1 Tax=Parasponia andersonii TaxID=3476 RepID=A0A2P5D4G6_PARAD|nr:Pentatricopeptide repeat [Parasponia andersonii]
MDLFWEILGKKHPCDEVTYATIIDGLCKAGKTSEALELLTKKHDGKWIKPSVYCSNPIVDSPCKEGRMDESLSLFHDMINYGVVPDVVTYNSLIHGMCKSCPREEAKRFLVGFCMMQEFHQMSTPTML